MASPPSTPSAAGPSASSSSSPMMTATPARIDFKLTRKDGPTRRISFPNRPRWAVLAAKIASLYDLPLDALALAYIDADGDDITLNSGEELDQYYADVPDLHLIKFDVRSLPGASRKAAAVPSAVEPEPAAPVEVDGRIDWARRELQRGGVEGEASDKVLGAFAGLMSALGGRGHHRGPPHHRGPHHHRFGPPPHHFPPWHHGGHHGPPPFDPYGPPPHHRGPPPFFHHRGPPPPHDDPFSHHPPPHHHDRHRARTPDHWDSPEPPHSRPDSAPLPPDSAPASPEAAQAEASASPAGGSRRDSASPQEGRSPNLRSRRAQPYESSPHAHHAHPHHPRGPSASPPPPPPPYPHQGPGWGHPPPPPPFHHRGPPPPPPFWYQGGYGF